MPFQSTKVYFRSTKSALSKYKSLHPECKSILSTYKSTLSNYKSILSKYNVEIQKYTSKVQKCPSKVQKYTFEIQKYTLEVQKYTFKVQSNFRNLGNRISGIRNLLNTFGSRNPVPRSRKHWITYPNLGTLEPVPGTSSPTSSRNGSRNRFPEPVPGTSSPGTHPNFGTGSWNLEPWNLSKPWNLGTGSWNLEPNRFPERFPELSRNPPGTFPEPVFSRNRPSSPSTHRNLYWAETPIAKAVGEKKSVLLFDILYVKDILFFSIVQYFMMIADRRATPGQRPR